MAPGDLVKVNVTNTGFKGAMAEWVQLRRDCYVGELVPGENNVRGARVLRGEVGVVIAKIPSMRSDSKLRAESQLLVCFGHRTGWGWESLFEAA